MSALPADTPPGPPASTSYAQKNECIKSEVSPSVSLVDEPAAQAMLNIRTAQQFSTGAGVTVAVIDTGVNPHPFLTSGGRLLSGGDYIAPGPNSDGRFDCDGHGTLTAGIVAANTSGTGLGFTGVAPDAKIMAVRQTSTQYQAQVGGQDTRQSAGTPGTLASAIRRAVDQHVGVITTSVDTCLLTTDATANMRTPGSEVQQLQAAVHYAIDNNVVVVNSAGNTPSQSTSNGQAQQGQFDPCPSFTQNNSPDPNGVQAIEIPAVFSDDLLSVASVDPASGSVSGFSVWGPWVNIAAPGEGIISIDPGPNGTGLANQYSPPGSTSRAGAIEGTSFAAPYVAGVAALVRSRFPTLSARQVIQRIEATAQHPSAPGGRNNQIGYGIIDPVAALTAVVPGQDGVPVVGNHAIPAQLPRAAAKDWTPVQVALIGSAIGVALLLTTLFVKRTTRRRQTPDL